MNLSRAEILQQFNTWLIAWNEHDLDRVMEFIHEDIIFENWDDSIISGKIPLKRSWSTWFRNHGNFKFIFEDILIDEAEQKMTFTWKLQWPSLEKNYFGKQEKRRGVDILYLKEGKIYKKNTYSKTTLEIDSVPVHMFAV